MNNKERIEKEALIEAEIENSIKPDNMIVERWLSEIKFNEQIIMASRKSGKAMIDAIFNSNYGFGESQFNDQANVIPGGKPGRCCRNLVVAISARDSINTRLLEIVRHCAIKCRNYTKKVHIITSKWDANIWNEYLGDFRDMGMSVYLYQLDVPGPKMRLA